MYDDQVSILNFAIIFSTTCTPVSLDDLLALAYMWYLNRYTFILSHLPSLMTFPSQFWVSTFFTSPEI